MNHHKGLPPLSIFKKKYLELELQTKWKKINVMEKL